MPMKFVLYTNSLSAHQLPLAREIVKRVGTENFRYVYSGECLQGGAQEVHDAEPWVIRCTYDPSTVRSSELSTLLETCDVLLTGGLRPTELIARRLAAGRLVLYMSERWFKPIPLCIPLFPRLLPGSLRLLVPSYRRMAKKYADWLANDSNAWYLGIGPWAKKDMMSLGVPASKIVDWGYFVSPSLSAQTARRVAPQLPLRVLWVGRMLDLKRVDTIIKAVVRANRRLTKEGTLQRSVTLSLVGDGPEKANLQRLAVKLQGNESNSAIPCIEFRPPVSLAEVRTLMRAHDLYVFSSNGMDGWGAVVSEAAEEGMVVVGTRETGASAAMLPPDNLFSVGDVVRLAELFCRVVRQTSDAPRRIDMAPWRPAAAAERLFKVIEKVANGRSDSGMR